MTRPAPSRRAGPLAALAAMALPLCAAPAEVAPFDLPGPTVRVSVTQAGVTLPIANVPQLATGDVLTVRADLPDSQSAHYLLVAAFLRGATNPPPDTWFFRAPTWTKKGKRGLTFTVPDGAQQVALFLAPATGGDFSTLRNAVQGRPGAFVRAAQELTQASLDRARLETYLAAVRKSVPGDPDRLERITPLLARSLQVKIDPNCLAKLPELQAPCLLQNQESLVLNDGHSNAITDAVEGPGTDLALQLSATPQGGLGYYSPYIAAIRDIIGILGSIRTAKYQYIPALGTFDGDRMGLVLNAPPSFHNPKSVLVSALPIVAPIRVPPLQLASANPALCVGAGDPLLPMTGAPLVYATDYAHGLALRVTAPGAAPVDLPATPDAERGGLVIHVDGRLPAGSAPLTGTLRGIWGFQPFEGPSVPVVRLRPDAWRAPDEAEARGAAVTLTGGAAACIRGVTVRTGDAAPVAARWTVVRPDAITVALPGDRPRAARTIEIAGPAGTAPDRVTLSTPHPLPAPAAGVIARAVRPAAPAGLPITLASEQEVPSDATLTVSLRAAKGQRFTGHETIEVAAETGSDTASLTEGRGLTLVDPQVMLATIAPARLLGASAYGPLRARIVRDGVAGEWIALGTLVRLPTLSALTCPPDPAAACTLAGERLFLLAGTAGAADQTAATPVPDGFPGTTIAVPRPAGDRLFLRLHDDPAATASIGVTPAPAATAGASSSKGG